MIRKEIVVVDYGVGNLFSVQRALEVCGFDAALTDDPERISDAERIVLPGVGAFSDGMAELRSRGLIEPIRGFVRSGRPFLGICLGMQMMFERSFEFGEHEGLGLVPGEVRPISRTGRAGLAHKIPHVGWSELIPSGDSRWDRTILDGLESGSAQYFVHSFAAEPAHDGDRLADTNYNGLCLAAVIGHDRAWGCQFHPERGGPLGLRIIRNFCSL